MFDGRFDKPQGISMKDQEFVARLFNETCPVCKTIGIEVTHPPAVWAAIVNRERRQR